MKKIKTTYWKRAAILGIWLFIWQFASVWIGHEVLLASPKSVCLSLLQLIQEGEFWRSIACTLGHIMLGFMLAVFIGCFLAVISSRMRWVHEFLYPVLSMIKATPVASFIILALIWINSANLSTFISFIMVLPMVYSSIYQAIQQVDPKLLELGQAFGFSKEKILREIYFPSVKPYLLSSCTVGMGFAWKSGVAAEVIGYPAHTIGNQLYYAKIYLHTSELFAWTLVIVILSVLMEQLFVRLVYMGKNKTER